MRRYSFYHVKPTHSTLERRGLDTSNTWHVAAIVCIFIACSMVLAFTAGKIKDLIRKRRLKARGEGRHLRASLSRYPTRSGREVENGPYSPSPFDDDESKAESGHAVHINMPSRPLNAYRNVPSRSMRDEETYRQLTASGRRHDGFEATPLDGARSEEHYGRRF
ncbi:uncharacterized protein RCC_05543 [Ramularia collo-cygni]|uniref:Uncharacterized protein n=1 Tax=Ramularia collo-cygni TaxID=112498 RepID=A0A2D3UTF1_9PEZI|nr:uncharacterized protein RCC_05543 [Ramularia collo-cygni]CZT19691.1 uncharacterized protein RCC_05543 [Ramularia collo-cygni]